MARSSTLRKIITGIGTLAIILTSASTSNTIHITRLLAHLVETSSSTILFISTSLALAIHRSYPENHDNPSDFSKLFMEGPYRMCRHPFYLLIIANQLSIPLVMLSIWGFLVAISLTPLWIFLIKLEEKELIAYWGRRYVEYMKHVPMLIPVLKGQRTTLKTK